MQTRRRLISSTTIRTSIPAASTTYTRPWLSIVYFGIVVVVVVVVFNVVIVGFMILYLVSLLISGSEIPNKLII